MKLNQVVNYIIIILLIIFRKNKVIVEDWQLDDPDGKPLETFYRVRDEIKQKVEELIKKL